jgi:hypothetical protein
MSFSIRDFRATDLDAVLELNESVVPAVNSLSADKMRWFAGIAPYYRVAADDEGVGAFLIGLGAGVPYESLNYQWFSSRYESFGYVDRVAVAKRARRCGLASALYEDFSATLTGRVPVLLCEVNIRPPNEMSMRFHKQLGFVQVGAQETEAGGKEVALLEKRL